MEGLTVEEKHNSSFFRSILDAIPLMVLVVDEEARILDMNTAARNTLDVDATLAQGMRNGDLLHCLHVHDTPGGCGRGPSCKRCVIRNSVGASMRGQPLTRRRTKATLQKGGKTTSLELLITTKPIQLEDKNVVLLTIEDVTEMSDLRNIIPICSHCKKIRDDDQFWQEVEHYFTAYAGVDFSHAICPTCMEEFYPQVARKLKADHACPIPEAKMR